MKLLWPYRKTIAALMLLDTVLMYAVITFYLASWGDIFR